MIVMPDFGTSTTQSDTNISLNTFLVPVNGDSIVGIDMLRGASLGNLSIVGLQITNNIFNGETTTNSTAILFPTSGSFSGVNIIGNLFHGPWIKLKNFFGSYGGALFTPLMGRLTADWQNDDIVFENIAGGVLTFNVIPSATYQFTCTLLYTAAATTNGVTFAMTGPTSPTSFTYETSLCDSTNNCTTAGTANVVRQVGSGDDATATVTTNTPNTGTNIATVRGILNNGANAGTLIARIKAPTVSTITVLAGSGCIVQELP